MDVPSVSLSAGDRLGRYQIVSLLGTGGMGEVYRARDPELHRDVALKVLRPYAASPDDVARFTREARAAGSLNHPNIVAVHDAGVHGGTPYVVTELLEGETLRARLDHGPLPFLKAVEYGTQIADALDAAHAKQIWHRDVKPANAFITTDGRVKLLDFGLAKLAERSLRADANEPTAELSDPRGVFGTAGYMSPEQVRGEPADHRADIFALGAVLYEMFTRARAFKRPSAVQTMTAILEEDPADPQMIKPDLPPMAVAIVRRCLEKNKEERFQSARDLAFHLRQLRDVSGVARVPLPAVRRRRRRMLPAAGAAAVLGGALVTGWMLAGTPPSPVFEQLTFRHARISGARFAGEDRSVVYSESLQGHGLRLWRRILGENPPTQPLEYAGDTDIVGSRAGELTLLTGRRFVLGERFAGTLASAPLGGGPARGLQDGVEDADWDAPGTSLAVVRSSQNGGPIRLEYPLGTPLHETSGSIRFPRVSPDGRLVAFIEDPVASGEGGTVAVVDASSRAVTVLTGAFNSARGLEWSADGNELWFAAGSSRSTRQLLGVTTARRQRIVLSVPGSLTLWDIARDGRVLLSRDDEQRSLVGKAPGETGERDLSWLDDSGLADISSDGRTLLFSDRFGVYLRDIAEAQPTRLDLTDVFVDDLSADKEKVLATRRDGSALVILSTNTQANRVLPAHGIVTYRGARWFPDGQRVLFTGQQAGRALRSWMQDLAGGPPVPLTPEHVWALAISADGRLLATRGESGISLYATDGAALPRLVAGSLAADRPVCFSDDGRVLWAYRRDEVPAQVIRFDLAGGTRQVWRTLMPSDPSGVYAVTEFSITPDGESYYYSYKRQLSQLYLVSGLR